MQLVESATPTESRFDVALHKQEATGDTLAERERVVLYIEGEAVADVEGLTVSSDSGLLFEFTTESLPRDFLVDDIDEKLVVDGGTTFVLVSRGAGSHVLKSGPPVYVVDVDLGESLLSDGHATITLSRGDTTLAEKRYRCTE